MPGILAHNLVQHAQELAGASTSSAEEVFGMEGVFLKQAALETSLDRDRTQA